MLERSFRFQADCELEKAASERVKYDEVVGILKQTIGNLENQIEARDATIAYYRNILHTRFGLTQEAGQSKEPTAEDLKIKGPVHLSRDLAAIERQMRGKNADQIRARADYWRGKNAEFEAKEKAAEEAAKNREQPQEKVVESGDLEILDLENLPPPTVRMEA